jgi:C-terminal processing protease CtpA/Prc
MRFANVARAGLPGLALCVVLAAPAAAQSADSVRLERLAALGRLWGVVKYFHPALLTRAVDWDSAAVVAIANVSAARDASDYRAAVAAMLAALGDPATHVVAPPQRDASDGRPGGIGFRWEGDSTLVVSAPSFTGDSVREQLMALMPAVRAARRIVFDLRGPAPSSDDYGTAAFWLQTVGLAALLPARPMAAPPIRRRMYSGFPPATGATSGGYWAGSYLVGGDLFTPSSGNPERRVGFVVYATSDVPSVAWALGAAGQGVVVLDSARGAVLATSPDYAVRMGEGVEARVSVGEMIGPSGVRVAADTAAVRSGADDVPLRLALALVRAAAVPQPPAAQPPPFAPPAEASYPDRRYPALPYRVLAAYRWWNAIHYFYPYRTLIGQDWGAVLPRSIARLESARDSLEYVQAVAAMVAEIHDSHGSVVSAALTEWFGAAAPGVLVQYVEGRPIVIRVADDSATTASGIAVGDEILSVDGATAAERWARLEPFLAHSTPQALDNIAAVRLLRGPDGSTARLTVRSAGGRVHDVEVPRRVALNHEAARPRSGPILRLLPGNVGYADLARLPVGMVDSMFEMFRGTRAIILDDRGYPQGTAWAIAPRLTDRTGVVAARFRRPLVMSPDSTESSEYAFTQSIPTTDKWRYHGKTVMLMDERTISQAEHTGLFFEAANHTLFVGSPTEGANGDVTSVVLPGGITAWFTGHDVRHADGRQLQRVGLTPDILVRPTIAGIRAGRDEVLERALRVLRAGTGPVR